VLYPSDGVSAERLTALAAQTEGIVYLRTSRPKTELLYTDADRFSIGGSKVLRSSPKDVATVVAAGVTVHEALKAHAKLEQEGIAIRVIDAYSVKPIDEETLRRAAAETKKLITVEDHAPCGGLGEAVAALGLSPTILAVRRIPRSGKPDELMAWCGIDAAAIAAAVRA
jgi:transketolase